MRIKNISLALLVIMTAKMALSVGPINFNAATFLKRLNYSSDYPIDLYISTDANHPGAHFVARTLAHLGNGNSLSDYDKKSLRNEICASNLMYSAAPNDAEENLAGSLGVYQNGRSIVSVTNTGMAGERLDAVLRKLSKQQNNAAKLANATYFARAMTKVLSSIHAANLTWGNLDLHNFFVKAEGGLYGVDLSAAKTAPVGAGDVARNAEAQDLARRVIREMVAILFPDPSTANDRYIAIINADMADLAGLQGRLGGDLADANGDLGGWANVNDLFLQNNAPYKLSVTNGLISITKADHHANVGGDQMIVGATLINNNNADILKLPDGNPYADKAAYCAGWTGDE